MAVELLSARVKNDERIKGVQIEENEIVLGQYADDTFFTLDGTKQSLTACLNVLHEFYLASGLRCNLDKTKAIWIGASKYRQDTLSNKIQWLKEGEVFKVLGINFSTNLELIEDINFNEKIKEIKNLVQSWRQRFLTLKGKICITKSLILPKLIHLFTSLPSPSLSFFKNLDKIIYAFIWNGGPDKIKRKTLISSTVFKMEVPISSASVMH